uniref:Mitochondrial proton/calcium exchanger protein n=1 Tax=Octactis speculum TaxID=3111310 RepID=A0A7S2HMY0_9STRA
MFRDYLTLDNISRTQLVAMCNFMSLRPYGADPFLRYQLRTRIRDLQEDDRRILWEGVESLSRKELQDACTERGMQGLGLKKSELTNQLQQWLDLSCQRHVPISMLILSRSFYHLSSPNQSAEKAIADSISLLDEQLVKEVAVEVATPAENATAEMLSLKLEVLSKQNLLIHDEKEKSKEKSKTVSAAAAEQAREINEEEAAEVAQDETPDSDDTETAETESDRVDVSVEEIEALADFASKSALEKEKVDVEGIKAAIKEIEIEKEIEEETDSQIASAPEETADMVQMEAEASDVSPDSVVAQVQVQMEAEASDVSPDSVVAQVQASADRVDQSVESGDESTPAPSESATEDCPKPPTPEPSKDPVASLLEKKLGTMLAKLEVDLEKVDHEIGEKLHMIDLDNDGLLSAWELQKVFETVMHETPDVAAKKVKTLIADLDYDMDGLVSVEDLRNFVKMMKKTNKKEQVEESGTEPVEESGDGHPFHNLATRADRSHSKSIF